MLLSKNVKKIFVIEENKDFGFFTVEPVCNRSDTMLITYDVSFFDGTSENEKFIAEKSNECKFFYPPKTSGKLKITSYYDDAVQNIITKYFTAL